MRNNYHIGHLLIDEDGNEGIVVIKWNDGDLCAFENDAAHPNPKITGHWLDTQPAVSTGGPKDTGH